MKIDDLPLVVQRGNLSLSEDAAERVRSGNPLEDSPLITGAAAELSEEFGCRRMKGNPLVTPRLVGFRAELEVGSGDIQAAILPAKLSQLVFSKSGQGRDPIEWSLFSSDGEQSPQLVFR